MAPRLTLKYFCAFTRNHLTATFTSIRNQELTLINCKLKHSNFKQFLANPFHVLPAKQSNDFFSSISIFFVPKFVNFICCGKIQLYNILKKRLACALTH